MVDHSVHVATVLRQQVLQKAGLKVEEAHVVQLAHFLVPLTALHGGSHQGSGCNWSCCRFFIRGWGHFGLNWRSGWHWLHDLFENRHSLAFVGNNHIDPHALAKVGSLWCLQTPVSNVTPRSVGRLQLHCDVQLLAWGDRQHRYTFRRTVHAVTTDRAETRALRPYFITIIGQAPSLAERCAWRDFGAITHSDVAHKSGLGLGTARLGRFHHYGLSGSHIGLTIGRGVLGFSLARLACLTSTTCALTTQLAAHVACATLHYVTQGHFSRHTLAPVIAVSTDSDR
mmetsp:Transcript_29914/g.59459  ORF Transcript_29914/g.59459 Transcript_29914/m.59459 type:complete len:284 (+) Transcript_29914:96-947(+)